MTIRSSTPLPTGMTYSYATAAVLTVAEVALMRTATMAAGASVLHDSVAIDFRSVTQVDAAAIAPLTSLIALLRALRVTVHLYNIPGPANLALQPVLTLAHSVSVV